MSPGGRANMWVIGAAVLGSIVVAVPASSPPAVAAAATFDPIPASTSFGASSAFPSVVAAGDGRYHAVARTSGLRETIEHRLSTDGGTTWVTTGRFTGVSTGVTRPAVAVDGDRVAVAFIGGWCATPGVCGEAPYLVTSTTAGRTWGPPVRLDGRAFDVDVAVDGDRTWVAWDRGGAVEIRGTAGTGLAFFETRSAPGGASPFVAADDGAVVVAWDEFAGPRAIVGVNSVLGPVQTLGDADAALGSWDTPVAAAGGRVHVLVDNAGRLEVASAAPVFDTFVDVAAKGYSASITARRGVVAVAVADTDGTSRLATSADGGTTFSIPVAVASTPGNEPLVDVGVAVHATDRPVARFDWSVPDRYVAGPGGRRVPANALGDPGLDRIVVDRPDLTVELDGCASLAPPGRTIVEYRWTIDGSDLATTTCTAQVTLTDGDLAKVRLEATDDQGTVGAVTQDVQPHDHVIVSLGDSVASGEGNPHAPAIPMFPVQVFESWRDDACHRSDLAGPALAAARVEDADPRSSVTFVHLACSGASIIDVPDAAGTAPSGADDPDTGGLLDPYHGIDPAGRPPRPSQLDQLGALLGNREVDALMLSIGANDVRFSEVVEQCIKSEIADPQPCHRSGTATRFGLRLATLSDRYAQLATALDGMGIASDRVHLSEYFDLTTDSLGLANLRCTLDSQAAGEYAGYVSDFAGAIALAAVAPNVVAVAEAVEKLAGFIAELLDGGLVTDDETAWARSTVVGGINAAVAGAAAAHGWTLVDGIAARYDGHGYCAADPWVVRLGESFTTQLDVDGAFHPNGAGHAVYGAALGRSLAAQLGTAATGAGAGTPPAGAPPVGDIQVVTSTRTTVTASAARDTGGVPLPLGTRTIDRVVSGDGYVGPGGAPASDEATAVATWMQVAGDGSVVPSARLGQLAVKENASVRRVSIVQAPEDGARVVAGRPSVVLATVDASLAAAQTVDVTTEVYATGGDGTPRTVVAPVTQTVRLTPGRNELLLPTAATFTMVDGEQVGANVTVTDPVGADPADEIDNTGTTASDRMPTAVTTRPMSAVFLPGGATGATPTSCTGVGRAARRMADYVSAAVPVDATGLVADVACVTMPISSQDEPGILQTLADLDHLARLAAVDAVVAVVPDGWLQTAIGGAVGASAAGLRGVIVESSAPSEVLSHELAHTLGVGHTADMPASGARVATRTTPRGIDWMNPRTAPKVWTGGATWETLVDRIGGPSSAPQPADPSQPGAWVRGAVTRLPDGSWVVSPAVWSPAAPGQAPPPIDPDELELERLVARQVGAGGETVDEEPVGLGGAAGLYAAGAAVPEEPIGLLFAAPIDLHPAAVAVHLVLDGVIVETRDVNAAPTVEVTAPAAGATVGRGGDLTVTWTAADPDADALTATLLVSDDDGATWQPLATGVIGSTWTDVVPADLDGPLVRVRVVVTDGVRSAWDDSDAFAVDGGGGAAAERVVFTRRSTSVYDDIFFEWGRLFTMTPDGGDVQPVPLPHWGDPEPPRTCLDANKPPGCHVDYYSPTWAPDGTIYFTATLRDVQFMTPEEIASSNRNDSDVFAVRPDGSGLRRISPPPPATGQHRPVHECADVRADGGRVAWFSTGGIVTANPDGSDFRTVWGSSVTTTDLAFVAGSWPTPVDENLATAGADIVVSLEPPARGPLFRGACPVWSPDGTKLAFLVTVNYRFDQPGIPSRISLHDRSAVMIVDADGSEPTIVTPPTEYVLRQSFGNYFFEGLDITSSVEWASDGRIVLGRSSWDAPPVSGTPTPPTGAFELDPATATLTRLTADRPIADGPRVFDVAPDGRLYGVTFEPLFTCGPCFPDFNLAIVDPEPDEVSVVPAGDLTWDEDMDWALVQGGPTTAVVTVPPTPDPAGADAGGPYAALVDEPIELDAGASTALAAPGGATADVAWDLDGDGSFDDAGGVHPLVSFPTAGTVAIRVRIVVGDATSTSEPVDVTVAEAPVIERPPAPGADALVPALPAATDMAVTIPAGDTTVVTLEPAGTGARFAVVAPPPPDELAVTPPSPTDPSDPPGVVTGADGQLLLTPADGFLGVTTFSVAVALTSGTATITVTVVGNAAPSAVDDEITVRVGEHVVLPPAALTGNDIDPDGDAANLAVAWLGGATNGDAWLDPDGDVHITAATPGAGEATYVVTDDGGATSSAVVRLTVLAPTPASTAPEPTAPATPAEPVPPTTAPVQPASPTTSPGDGGAGPPPTTAPTIAPIGTLPATGQDVRAIVRVGVVMGVAGWVLLAATRRRPPRRLR